MRRAEAHAIMALETNVRELTRQIDNMAPSPARKAMEARRRKVEIEILRRRSAKPWSAGD